MPVWPCGLPAAVGAGFCPSVLSLRGHLPGLGGDWGGVRGPQRDPQRGLRAEPAATPAEMPSAPQPHRPEGGPASPGVAEPGLNQTITPRRPDAQKLPRLPAPPVRPLERFLSVEARPTGAWRGQEIRRLLQSPATCEVSAGAGGTRLHDGSQGSTLTPPFSGQQTGCHQAGSLPHCPPPQGRPSLSDLPLSRKHSWASFPSRARQPMLRGGTPAGGSPSETETEETPAQKVRPQLRRPCSCPAPRLLAVARRGNVCELAVPPTPQ